MKMFMEEFKVLDMSELIVVNGGYSSYSGYSSGSYGTLASGYGTTVSTTGHSVVPVGYVPGKGWLPGYGATTTIKTDDDNENDNNSGDNSLAMVANGIAFPLGEQWNDSFVMTSDYGYRDSVPGTSITGKNFHNGIDFAAPSGTRINSVGNGFVSEVGYNSTLGNYVVIKHPNGTSTRYAHCNTVNISVGTNVSAGQKIATVGSTGVSSGNHLHLQYDANGNGSFTDQGIDDPRKVLAY